MQMGGIMAVGMAIMVGMGMAAAGGYLVGWLLLALRLRGRRSLLRRLRSMPCLTQWLLPLPITPPHRQLIMGAMRLFTSSR
jgi:hypothetical protein